MKKNKILIVVLLSQLLLIGGVHAKCDFKSFPFGISHSTLVKELKLDPDLVEQNLKGAPVQMVFAPGQKVCKNEKAFDEYVPVHFLLLYDKLVEIQIMRTAENPELINWAESIYGVKQDKPNSFYNLLPNAQWLWEKADFSIAYSIMSYDTNEVSESIVIQSLNHQEYFDRFADSEVNN